MCNSCNASWQFVSDVSVSKLDLNEENQLTAIQFKFIMTAVEL